MNRNKTHIILLLCSVAAILTFTLINQINHPAYAARVALQHQVLAALAPSPFRYRVLVPFSMSLVIQGLAHIVSYHRAFVTAYAVFDYAIIFSLLYTLYLYCRRWFSSEHSLIGVLFVAGTMPIVFRDFPYMEWSLLEVSFFTVGLRMASLGRYRPLLFVVLLASLNRETALFLPIAVFFTLMHRVTPSEIGKALRVTLPLFLIWLTIFVCLRIEMGQAHLLYNLKGLFRANLVSLRYAATYAALFLGIFWIWAIRGWKHAPEFVRRSAYMVPCYLIFFLAFGAWPEVRLLMTLYAVLIPLGLSYLCPVEVRAASAIPELDAGHTRLGNADSSSSPHEPLPQLQPIPK